MTARNRWLAMTLVLCNAGVTKAWNATGHEVIALMAYEQLDGPTRKAIQEIFEHHPHYTDYLAKNVPIQACKERWVVMKASTWPDWVRSGPRSRTKYHRATWHYVNKPHIVVDDDDDDTREEIEAEFSNPNQNRGDILWVIPLCQKIIKAPAKTEKQKANRAVFLCWLFHLVQDCHQPLHAATLCNKQLMSGDRGGNIVWVRRKGDGDPRRLHAVWDSLLGNFETYDEVVAVARFIEKNAAAPTTVQDTLDADKWADESLECAKMSAYSFKGKLIDLVIDSDSHGPSIAPRLPEGYEAQATQIARDRATLAAYRLAGVLRKCLSE